MTGVFRRWYRALLRSMRPLRRALGQLRGIGQTPQDIGPFISALRDRVGDDQDLVILDVGSRHGLEARQFASIFPGARIFCFEANPEVLGELRANLTGYENVAIVPKAVNSYDGTCSFFAIDPKKTVTTHPDGNLGASSLFRASGDYDHVEKYEQFEITVDCIRLESFLESQSIERVHGIWMDLQGAELVALKSLGERFLSTTLVIQTELESKAIYEGQALAQEVVPWLENHGFQVVASEAHGDYAADYVFARAVPA